MATSTGASLVVPLVLWGKSCPSHTITCLTLSHNQKTLLTGSSEGQICLWDFESPDQVMPKMMFYGQTGSITSVAAAGPARFASADDTGEMCLWDISDGQCLESKKSSLIHSSIQTYRFEGKKSYSLLCNGHYPEIHILNADSLEIIYSLVARVHPDWVNAFCMLKPLKREEDVILAVTSSGTIKMWSINVQTVNSLHVYEDESKQIRCVDAKMIRCCAYNQRTVLIVCAKYWQIYDAGEFSLLCAENAPKSTQWSGGTFIAVDKVVVWNSADQAFVYILPSNSNPEHGDYHHLVGTKAVQQVSPILSHILASRNSAKILSSPSVFLCEREMRGVDYLLLRADADSSVHCWTIKASAITPQAGKNIFSTNSMSLGELWTQTSPLGLLDQVQAALPTEMAGSVSCSLYIETSGRLICGQSDGVIVIVPILHTARNLLLSSSKDKKGRLPMYRMLKKHKARVNCLLYPHSVQSRYNPNYLLSGSADFSVCLWDLASGQLLHTFAVHAGEVTNFYIPPATCNSRILSCVCSVANDHSVALLSLRERRPLVFASRHMFPVQAIKWRPVEDFMVISCTDFTAYIWQMETGLLDRVVHGVTAVEILKACDDAAVKINVEDNAANTQISLSQALKRRNMAAFKNLAQQTIQGIENLIDDEEEEDNSAYTQEISLAYGKSSLAVQSIKSSPLDADAHVLLFDTEALIIQLLCDEFGLPNFSQMASKGAPRVPADIEQKFTDFVSMVKDKAEGIVQAGAQPGRCTDVSAHLDIHKSNSGNRDKQKTGDTDRQSSFSMEVAQTLLSVIHAWTLDNDLDTLCVKKLGLERLNQDVSFGLLSATGHAAFMLPKMAEKDASCEKRLWEVSPALTTQHLLAVISLANTLMSLGNATFIRPQGDKKQTDAAKADQLAAKQSQIKQGWSLLAALHCVLLPDLINSPGYRGPQLHLLANRWQDRCLEVREAAQALLLAELRRIGVEGRRNLIRHWASYMPDLTDDANGSICLAEPEYELVADEGDEPRYRRVNTDKRRLEATAIVMMGVIGAEFGSDAEFGASHPKYHTLAWHTSKALSYLLLNPQRCKLPANAPIRRAAIDLLGRGFPIWQPYIDVSAILLGLLEICVNADRLIPSNVQSGLPLPAAADACRTARHALSLIATAQPATFLTCMAKEVARNNAAAQTAQSATQINSSVLLRSKSEILRIIEMLMDKLPSDVVELLTETMDVAVHCLDANSIKQYGLQETFPSLCKFPMVSYCGQTRRICVGSKNGSLAFYEIKQAKTQGIPFQASPTAAMMLYLKASSKEIISAHHGAVAAASFSADGKYLASYSPLDCKVHFWQTSSNSLFSSQHTKCVRSYSVPWRGPGLDKPNSPTKAGRLGWTDHRTVSLILPDGSETKYKV